MVSITLPGVRAAQALELVNELRNTGLIINQDFEWAYYNEQITHDMGGNEIIPKYCEFKFQNPKLATFYALKWQTMMN